jgi:energy-coupling factor transporter transmembrane protein EcfT
MITITNVVIWLLFLLVPLILSYIIHALIKKKKRKYVIRGILIFFGIIALLTIFYVPVQMRLDNPPQLNIIMDNSQGQSVKVENLDQIKEIKELVEKQMFIRSTLKTLNGIPPYPAKEGININFLGKDSLYIFVRRDAVQYSFLKRGKQYYTVLHTEKFVKEIFSFAEHIEQ